MPVMPFGKYKGLDYSEVPEDYLEFIIRSSRDQMVQCQTELMRRQSKVKGSFMFRIVEKGKEALQNSIEPEQQGQLNLAYDMLVEAINDAGKP